MATKRRARSSSAASTIFKSGVLVEISNDVDGFRGSWFTGKIVRRLGAKFIIEYDNIMTDEEGTKHLQESVKFCQLRPIPPKEINPDFVYGEAVDVYHNGGWREGRIYKLIGNGTWKVYFKDSWEVLVYSYEEVRPHHDWVDGCWIRPFPQLDKNEVENALRVKAAETVTGDKFKEGALVEVCSDEDGLKGAWFCATLVETNPGCKFIVEYESLLDDDLKFLREEVGMSHIRPRPPTTDDVVDEFKLHDEVDAYYNDGWWVGFVSKVLGESKYIVYFRNYEEQEMEFQHSQLRLHQDWVDNKWV